MDINRLPTKPEIVAGAVTSLALSSGLGFIIWFMVRGAVRRPELLGAGYLAVAVVLTLICLWSAALFFRVLLGSPRLPSLKGQAVIGYLLMLGGAFMCSAPLFSWFHGSGIQSFSQGLVGVVLGWAWASRARKAAHR